MLEVDVVVGATIGIHRHPHETRCLPFELNLRWGSVQVFNPNTRTEGHLSIARAGRVRNRVDRFD